ncbi:hypothetical protein ABZX88_08315 [Kitasatospora aureofaciens]|uniref:hypothetical protein n=1 Tax=Kitasatospora aureofaciens TaxID=1894 RepID=UPI0033AE27F0
MDGAADGLAVVVLETIDHRAVAYGGMVDTSSMIARWRASLSSCSVQSSSAIAISWLIASLS